MEHSNLLKRVKQQWEETAKETIEVEQIKGAIYGFGTELAVLRIEHGYRGSNPEKVRAGYSENMKSWYFVLEI